MIDNKFLYFKTHSAFDQLLNDGNINYGSIAFIEDTSTIWTHGKEYDASGGEPNKIEAVKVNNIPAPVGENKTVNIDVPENIALLNDDNSHRVVTDAEKEYWNSKADADNIEGVAYIGDNIASGIDPSASFNPYSDTVWNKAQTLSATLKSQVLTNIDVYGKSDTYNRTEISNMIPSAQNDIQIISSLPEEGNANTIYRVTGINSYSDYMWNGNAWVLLGTFDGAFSVDPAPTRNSTNPVQSGGMWSELYQLSDLVWQSQYPNTDPNVLTLSYIKSTGEIGVVDSLDLKLIEVSPGQQYRIVGSVPVDSNSACIFGIYSSSLMSQATAISVGNKLNSYGVSGAHTYDIVVTIPSGATTLAVLCVTGATYGPSTTISIYRPQNRLTAIEGDVISIKHRLDNVEEIIAPVPEMEADVEYMRDSLIGTGDIAPEYDLQPGYYVNNLGNIVSLPSYYIKLIEVGNGEVYNISGSDMVGSARQYAIYNSDTTLDSSTVVEIGDVVSSSYNTTITIPINAKTLAVVGDNRSTGNPNSVVIKKIYTYNKVDKLQQDVELLFNDTEGDTACKIENGNIIIAHRKNNKDICVQMGATPSGNNLFDFKTLMYRQSGENSLLDFTTDYENVQIGGTDWHAPFLVYAMYNINGDNKTGDVYNNYFTGGYHRYNNTGSGSTATARMSSLNYYIDGKIQTSYEGYCNHVTIKWTNFVQGANTTLAAGGGREILQESHTIELNNGIFNERVKLTPLEDIKIRTWYGIQARFPAEAVSFIDADNRKTITESGEVTCNSKECSEMILSNYNGVSTRMFVNQSFDLGKRNFVARTPLIGAFRSSNGKYYFRIIYNNASQGDFEFKMGDNYYLDCGYEFF